MNILNLARKMSTNTARKIDGKVIADGIKIELIERTKKLVAQGLLPHLAVVQVGARPDSESYVRMKQQASQKVQGFL